MANLSDLRSSTTDGTLPAHAWPGGYPMQYLTADGLVICPKCANTYNTSDPVAAGDVYWEGPAIVCDDGSSCGAMIDGTWRAGTIESAYGDPDALGETPMTGKYSDPIAEIAEAILNDGFADDQVGSVEYGEHYALVTLYHPMFSDAGRDLEARLDAYLLDRAPDLFTGSRIIIRTDSQGFVDTFYGPAHPLGDPAAFRALMAAWTEIVAAETVSDDA